MKSHRAYTCNNCSEPGHAEPTCPERLAGVSPGRPRCGLRDIPTRDNPTGGHECLNAATYLVGRSSLAAMEDLAPSPNYDESRPGAGKFGPGGMGARHYGERKR